MGRDEYLLWQAWNEYSPFGEPRDDLHAAIVARSVVNANRVKGRRAKIADFMPRFPGRKKTVAEAEAGLRSFLAAHQAFVDQQEQRKRRG